MQMAPLLMSSIIQFDDMIPEVDSWVKKRKKFRKKKT